MRLSVENERNHFHIFSLTDNNQNNMMWNLYAKNFTGLCFGYEFKTVLTENLKNYSDKYKTFFVEILDNDLNCEGLYLNQDDKFYFGLIKVKYAKRKPLKCRVFALNSKQEKAKIKESFLVKNNFSDKKRNKIDWSYEQESRIILYDYYKTRE